MLSICYCTLWMYDTNDTQAGTGVKKGLQKSNEAGQIFAMNIKLEKLAWK